ncbi:MAG TPA: RES family NAD+ phosphorylase [Longimicrobiales bacterium]|nr:RES family NAD+ phosphorylase [Longimicrobiales bacterium]
MIEAWRIVKRRRSDSAFDGEGARIFDGRWNSPGVSVVYTAETRALATLEVLAGLGSVSALKPYVLIPVTFDENLVESFNVAALPARWRESPPTREIQALGDQWAHEGRSAVLKVPSVVIPEESNYILNPAHSDFRLIKRGEPGDLQFDPRLVR